MPQIDVRAWRTLCHKHQPRQQIEADKQAILCVGPSFHFGDGQMETSSRRRPRIMAQCRRFIGDADIVRSQAVVSPNRKHVIVILCFRLCPDLSISLTACPGLYSYLYVNGTDAT